MDLINLSEQFVGCADTGFCQKCQVLVGDPTCFCGGGRCPICSNYVVPNRSWYKDLSNGYYNKYYVNNVLAPYKLRLKDGNWKICRPRKPKNAKR